MTEGWVKVYTAADFFKSEMVRQVLIDNEIDAVLLDKKGYPYMIGEVEIYIHEDNFHKALSIINTNEL